MPLYRCRCGRSACREHRLERGGCKTCAPEAFAAHARGHSPAEGWTWAQWRPRFWGMLGLALCGLAAFTVLERGAPRVLLLLIAALSLAALFKIVPGNRVRDSGA